MRYVSVSKSSLFPEGLRRDHSDLGSFYINHRVALRQHASRILKDSTRVDEVVHDAFIKLILAAPELKSEAHALAYLHRTIENLCIDIHRLEGRRPNLILLDDAMAEIEASWISSNDRTDALIQAEDAAVVRQALALLSPAERCALVMWEVEGRSTEEIATELGVSARTVRHTVSRARASLRRILSEFVIDESRGLTALDLLSTSYRKVTHVARKSSKVSLSLILFLFAFLGFDSMSPNIGISDVAIQESSRDASDMGPDLSKFPVTPGQEMAASSANRGLIDNKTSKEKIKSKLRFPGLDNSGVPTSFSAADSSGGLGSAYFVERSAGVASLTFGSRQIIKTDSDAANILIAQTLNLDENGLTYAPVVSFGQAGSWVPLEVRVTSTEILRLADGNFLLTVYIAVDSVVETSIKIRADVNGRDLAEAPRQVITRLVLDPSKTQVLAQALYVVEQGASA